MRDAAIDRFLTEVEQSPEVKAAGQRARVDRLAREDSAAALRQARAIGLPWYRCQALSSVVDARPKIAGAEAILLEAMDAAFAQEEPQPDCLSGCMATFRHGSSRDRIASKALAEAVGDHRYRATWAAAA